MPVLKATLGIHKPIKDDLDAYLASIPGAKNFDYNHFIRKAIIAIAHMQSINPAWYYNDITPDNQRPLEYNKNGGA